MFGDSIINHHAERGTSSTIDSQQEIVLNFMASHTGDVIMALPVIETLEKNGHEVLIAIHKQYQPLLKHFDLKMIDSLEDYKKFVTPPIATITQHATQWWVNYFRTRPTRRKIKLNNRGLQAKARDLLPNNPIAIISMDSRNPTKRMTREFWHLTMEVLKRRGYHIVTIAPPDQAKYVETITFGVGDITNLAGKDSPELLPYILNEADVVITTDTAVSHLADAMGKYTITTFALHNYRTYKPFWNPRVALYVEDVERYLNGVNDK